MKAESAERAAAGAAARHDDRLSRWALEVAALCEAAGLRYRVGAAFGSVLYAAANMQFVACTDVSYACEVGEFEHLSGDPFIGPSVQNGTLSVPDSPGLGVQLDQSVIDGGWVILAPAQVAAGAGDQR